MLCLYCTFRQLRDVCPHLVYMSMSRGHHAADANECPQCYFLPALCHSVCLHPSSRKTSIHRRISSCSKDGKLAVWDRIFQIAGNFAWLGFWVQHEPPQSLRLCGLRVVASGLLKGNPSLHYSYLPVGPFLAWTRSFSKYWCAGACSVPSTSFLFCAQASEHNSREVFLCQGVLA